MEVGPKVGVKLGCTTTKRNVGKPAVLAPGIAPKISALLLGWTETVLHMDH